MDISIACEVCEANQLSELKTSSGERILECPACGMLRRMEHHSRNPRRESETLKLETSEASQQDSETVLLRAEKFLEKRRGTKRVLHVECKLGHLLKQAESRGWQAMGSDQRRKAISFCKARGLEAIHATPYKLPFESHSFDLVVAADVLEQAEQLTRLVKEWKRVLKPGGLLYVSTTDVEDRPAIEWVSHETGGSAPRNGFTQSSMQRLARKCGLQTIEVPQVGALGGRGLLGTFRGTLQKASRAVHRSKPHAKRLDVFIQKPAASRAVTPVSEEWTAKRAA